MEGNHAVEQLIGVKKASHLEPYQLFDFAIAFEYISNASKYASTALEYVKVPRRPFVWNPISCSTLQVLLKT